MAAPLVSVIIAVYNGETCIARALESVFAQDFAGCEVLVVDDASRDSTPRILRRYGDRIRVIRRKRNRGLAAARNRGVDRANGRYVAFLDADDVWLPGRLAKTVAALEDRKTATLAFSDVVPVDDNYAPLAPSYLHPGMARPPMMEDLLEEGWWPILPSTVTIHRWAFNRAGGFAEEFRGASGFEDTEMWFMLREIGDFAYVPEPLVQYRLAPFVERMRKYAPGFGLFAARMRGRYGPAGDRLIRRCAVLYRWLLTVKGLQSLKAGDMRGARRALFCALRYEEEPGRLGLRGKLGALLSGAPQANGIARPQIAQSASDAPASTPDRAASPAAAVAPAAPARATATNGARGPSPHEREDLRRAYYSLLPQRQAVALMRRDGLLEIPPPPPSHVGFANDLLSGAFPLALY